MKRMRGGEMSGGDLGSQQISAGLVPRGEPRYYTTYLTCKDTEDEGEHGQIALFEEMRTTNILPRTSAYQVAVERASVDTKALPSYIAQVDTTSTNPNQLSALVGCELFWAGSLFPSTQDGAYIGADVNDSFITCGGSSLPIKYSMSSSGGAVVSVDSSTQYYNPAVSGVLEAWIENNPNSSYWTGQYSFNIKCGLFLASFQRAIDRAFAPWTYCTSPPVPDRLDLELVYRPSVYGDTWICDFNNFFAELAIKPDQLLLSDLQIAVPPGQPIAPEILAALQASFNGFYPIQSDIPATTYKQVGTTVTQKKLLAQAALVLTGQQQLSFTCRCYVYNKSASTSLNTGSPLVSFESIRTQVPGTSMPVFNSGYRNADTYLTLAFRNVRDDNGSGPTYQAVPCFDFYPTMTYSTVAQTDKGTITLAPRSMKSPFVDEKPSRDDYLASAWVLGFIPDTIFTMGQVTYNDGTEFYYANRPIAPAFVSRLALGSYQNLIWKPMDEFVSSKNPKPGSPYYYGYGTTSYLTDVVNPAISSCFENSYDDEFETGELPSIVMTRLLLQTPINAITDLSLSAQLYCMAYFNSSSAPKEAIAAISEWNSGQTYTAGSPVTFVNKDPASPIRNLYIANTTTNSAEPQEPIPFKNTEYWLYCGPFLYSSAIEGATYIAGELLTYNGSVRVYTPSYTGVTPPTFQFESDNLSPRMILVGGEGEANNFNKLKPTPVIGTAPPVMTLNTSPGLEGDVFELKCDTYGFGTYDSGKPTDYLRAYARDSWGCLQSDARSFNTNRIYDEFVVFESNTAFRDQFRGFPTLCKQYTDPITAVQSAYWLYNFVVDPSSSILPPMPAGWNDATIQSSEPDGYQGGSRRYLSSRIIGNDYTPVTSVQALRNSDSTVYFWTFTSSETSRYAGWNPVQSIVIEGQTIPVDAAHLPVSQPIVAGLTQPAYGEARMIIAEILIAGVPAEGTVIYEPQNPRLIFLSQSTDLKYFSYKLSWRNKFTGELVPLVLSQNGAALIVFMFTAKD